MNDKLDFWLWIASRIDEQETHPVVRRVREQAIQNVNMEMAKKDEQETIAACKLRKKEAERRIERLEIDLRHHQRVYRYTRIGIHAERRPIEELAIQHHSGMLFINNCVDLLEKQKDLLLQFKQLSQLNTNNTNTDIDTDIITEGSISVESNLVDTHLTHVNNKLELPSSNTVRHQNVSLTNAVVDVTILNENLNVNTHNNRLESGLKIPVTNAVVTDTSNSVASLELLEYVDHIIVCNQNVLSTNAVVNNTILKQSKSIGTLKKITESDLGYSLDISEMSIENVILQLLGSFRFRPTRSGSKAGLLRGMSDFLMTSLTSLPFDGGGRIRMMTSCTSLPFDGGGWIRMTL